MLVNACAATSVVESLYQVHIRSPGRVFKSVKSFHIAFARVFISLSKRLLSCACISRLHLGGKFYPSGRWLVVDRYRSAISKFFVLESRLLMLRHEVSDRENSVISQVQKSARARLVFSNLRSDF